MVSRFDDLQLHETSCEHALAGEVDGTVVGGARGELARVAPGRTLDQRALYRSHHGEAYGTRLRLELRLKALQPLVFLRQGNRVFELGGRRARARAVQEGIGAVELQLARQRERGLEVGG